VLTPAFDRTVRSGLMAWRMWSSRFRRSCGARWTSQFTTRQSSWVYRAIVRAHARQLQAPACGALLERQLSNATCSKGATFGCDVGGLWVSGGCRGRFVCGGRLERRMRCGYMGMRRRERLRCDCLTNHTPCREEVVGPFPFADGVMHMMSASLAHAVFVRGSVGHALAREWRDGWVHPHADGPWNHEDAGVGSLVYRQGIAGRLRLHYFTRQERHVHVMASRSRGPNSSWMVAPEWPVKASRRIRELKHLQPTTVVVHNVRNSRRLRDITDAFLNFEVNASGIGMPVGFSCGNCSEWGWSHTAATVPAWSVEHATQQARTVSSARQTKRTVSVTHKVDPATSGFMCCE
jgi:hypothetical protein